MNTFSGFDIIVDDEKMTRLVEDWSDVRSPSRAKRRMKRGFRQRVIYKKVPKTDVYQVGNSLIMHSEIKKELVRRIGKSESSNFADDLSFRYRAESESKGPSFRENLLWQNCIKPAYLSWVYN